ncbi:hypothetical protein [Thermogutta sp.]|uniref:hypothetical protein n=1 Tax=Thermogutta sp. TaxID=1962930 RepID=UPI0032208E3F
MSLSSGTEGTFTNLEAGDRQHVLQWLLRCHEEPLVRYHVELVAQHDRAPVLGDPDLRRRGERVQRRGEVLQHGAGLLLWEEAQVDGAELVDVRPPPRGCGGDEAHRTRDLAHIRII